MAQIKESTSKAARKYYQPTQEVLPIPNLTEIQTNSYNWFIREGIREVFDEVNPIVDFSGKMLELSFGNYYLDEPKYAEQAFPRIHRITRKK